MFRSDVAFAKREIYDVLEERVVKCAVRFVGASEEDEP